VMQFQAEQETARRDKSEWSGFRACRPLQ